MSTEYMNHVTVSRLEARARARSLGARLRTSDRGLAFLLAFLNLRKGPLQAIPQWLRTSAEFIEPLCPWTASELCCEAMTELNHQGQLEIDLAELAASSRTLPEPSRRREPALARHMAQRRFVPAKADPFVVLALDVEFAALDLELCPALLDGLTYAMPRTLHARRFIRTRSLDAQRRLAHSQHRLSRALRDHPERAAAWARVATGLVDSYLDVIEGYGPAPTRSIAA